MGGFAGSGIRLRHALAHAADLHRMCLINCEPAARAAKALGLCQEQTQGAVRLLRNLKYRPSPERLALVVMRDWGLDDDDIAEIFGRSRRWATTVRLMANELRAAQPIPEELEYLDCGLQRGDLSPAQLYERAAELRAAGVIRGVMVGARRQPWAMPLLSWTNDYAFLSVGVG
jgi:hypothetical protein